MKQVIAMHGWCSDGKYWDIWAKNFKSHEWYWESADRGYSNGQMLNPTWAKKTYSCSKNKRVLICHSLGTFLIGSEIISKASHIVFINSFSRFIPNSKESRSLEIGLKGMQKKLRTMQEQKMIYRFWEKAFSPHKIQKVNIELFKRNLSQQGIKKLREDLDLLINSKRLPWAINKKTKVLVIDGEKDKIVVPKAKNNLIEEIYENIGSDPEHWIISNEGHVILQHQIIEKTRIWLEAN